ncbi:WS/DGAT/MGAT family O-acyltransferase [Nocardioides campestrisoli]|uniref:WS/DGAT/MGAT family O-acyltransferase n=1 Tax=Nocardioides campestrisoli TaxID=2736757 RepID=UPI0015E738D0|nr:wax ester/triacylglycerol synthase family O-acyltransferase [Nocardioides campestrisoli]
MVTLLDPTSLGFLTVESRQMPMHVGGLHLFARPEDADDGYERTLVNQLRTVPEMSPLYLRHPHRSARTAGQLVWETDRSFDIEHHVRHSALPRPGGGRELLELVSRLHSTRLPWERPLWESHVIEGLSDGRVAIYHKIHHALMDGVSAIRLLNVVLSDDPEERGMLAPWALHPAPVEGASRGPAGSTDLAHVSLTAVRSALGLLAEAAGLPGALVRTLSRSVRDQPSTVSLHSPRTMLDREFTGARRFAAQDWPVERLHAVARSSGTTINDVVVAMTSGMLRRYLLQHDELPRQSLVAMVPVGLKAKESHLPSADGGNAVGAVMVRMGTEIADPAGRLRAVHESMKAGKAALASMTPLQIMAMSGLGQAQAMLPVLWGASGLTRPPYNVIVSNVPGPRQAKYFNGARLLGNYPASIPIPGAALNITCTSYDGKMCFGLTGCRRAVPRLQQMLPFLDEELALLEEAVGA